MIARPSPGALAALALLACSSSLPGPPLTKHHGDAPMIVPYPPPPARVEEVGAPPDAESRWVDGSWQFNGRSFVWAPGRWQRPPAGQAYAPPLLVRRQSGQLLYYPGRWLPTPPDDADAGDPNATVPR